MAERFVHPDISTGDIELRFENGEVCVYVTNDGLEKLISFCQSLRKIEGTEHLHLADYAVLKKASLTGVIARFDT